MQSAKSRLLEVPQITDLPVLRQFLIDEIHKETVRKPLNKIAAHIPANVVQLTEQDILACRFGQAHKMKASLKKRSYTTYLSPLELEELQVPANQRQFARRWCDAVSPLVEGDVLFALDERAEVTVNNDHGNPLVYSQIEAAANALTGNMGSTDNICVLPIDQADNLIHEMMSDGPDTAPFWGFEKTKGNNFFLGDTLFIPLSNDMFPLLPPSVPGVKHVNRLIMFNKNAVLYNLANRFDLDIRLNILVDELGIRLDVQVDTAWWDGLTVVHPSGVVAIEVVPV